MKEESLNRKTILRMILYTVTCALGISAGIIFYNTLFVSGRYELLAWFAGLGIAFAACSVVSLVTGIRAYRQKTERKKCDIALFIFSLAPIVICVVFALILWMRPLFQLL